MIKFDGALIAVEIKNEKMNKNDSADNRWAFSISSIFALVLSWLGLFLAKGRCPSSLLINIWVGAMIGGFLMIIFGKLRREQPRVWGLAVVAFFLAVVLSFSSANSIGF